MISSDELRETGLAESTATRENHRQPSRVWNQRSSHSKVLYKLCQLKARPSSWSCRCTEIAYRWLCRSKASCNCDICKKASPPSHQQLTRTVLRALISYFVTPCDTIVVMSKWTMIPINAHVHLYSSAQWMWRSVHVPVRIKSCTTSLHVVRELHMHTRKQRSHKTRVIKVIIVLITFAVYWLQLMG